MALDLEVYDNMLDKDPDKTYDKLREIMTKWIRKANETTNKKEREKAFGNIIKATPAQEKKDAKPKAKAVKDTSKSNAAPVLPRLPPELPQGRGVDQPLKVQGTRARVEEDDLAQLILRRSGVFFTSMARTDVPEGRSVSSVMLRSIRVL